MSVEKTKKRIEKRIAETQKSRSRTRLYAAAALLLLFLFCQTVLYLTFGEKPLRSGGRVLTQDNADILFEQAADAENASFDAVMNYDWHFENGKAFSDNAYVENSLNNHNAFYFTVTLTDNVQTILYVSPNLSPGEALDEIQLDAELPAGEYEAALTYYLLDEDGNTADTVGMDIHITVGNSALLETGTE